MADTIFLKHRYPSNIPLRTQYFYDGRATVRYGTIELPVDKPAWIERAFMLGFMCDPDSGQLLSLLEIKARASASTESAGEVDEGSDAGGQPGGSDRVRSRKQSRSQGVSEEGLDSSVGDGATVEAEGD